MSSDESDGEGEIFTVDRIRDFKAALEFNTLERDQIDVNEFDPSIGDKVWVIKYLVRWVGYDEPDDTWEPRRSFASWTYDNDIRRIEGRAGHDKHEELKRRIKRKNDKLRKEHLENEAKGKSKAAQASSSTQKGRSTSNQPSQKTKSSTESQKGRTTQNSGSHVFDVNEMVQAGNASSAMAKLRLSPPPNRKGKQPRREDTPGSADDRGRSTSPVLAQVVNSSAGSSSGARTPSPVAEPVKPATKRPKLRAPASSASSGPGSDADDDSVANQLGRPQSQSNLKRKKPVIQAETTSGDDDITFVSKPASKKAGSTSRRPAPQSPPTRNVPKKKPRVAADSDGDVGPAQGSNPSPATNRPAPTTSSPSEPVPALKPPKTSSALTKPSSVPVPASAPQPSTVREPSSDATASEEDVPLAQANKSKLILELLSESDEDEEEDDVPLASLQHSTPVPPPPPPSAPSQHQPSSARSSVQPPPRPPSVAGKGPDLAEPRQAEEPASPPEAPVKLINLADEKIRIEFRKTELSRKLPNKALYKFADQIKAHWRIGGPENAQENEFDLEGALTGKTVFLAVSSIDGGIKSGIPGEASRARETRGDILALQLLLDSIPGVKQAEEIHSSVTVVFVHARDRAELGKPGSKLGKIESLRSQVSHCFVFGEAEVEHKPDDSRRGSLSQSKEKWFRNVWTLPVAMTVTPAALLEHPNASDGLMQLCELLAEHRSSRDGRPDAPVWAPASYFVPGGAFEVKPLVEGEDKPHIRAVAAIHQAAQQGLVPLTGPFPTVVNSKQPPATRFPLTRDVVKYDQRRWAELARWLPAELWVRDLAGLLRDLALYKAQNDQVRRWVVVASAGEVAKHNAASTPGVDVVTFDQAQSIAQQLL